MELIRAHQTQKEHARDMLSLILSSVRFLARQGLDLKEEIGSDVPGVLTMCPTRWTVRANSLARIMTTCSCYGRLLCVLHLTLR